MQTPILHVKDNTVFANSRDVADYFGKEHKNVMRDIREIGSNLSASDFNEMFVLSKYQDVLNRNKDCYEMTKDGFTILVMGYTGPDAMKFKMAYIQRFNEMEAELRNQAPAIPDFTNPAEAARAFAEQYEQKQIAEQKALVFQAKAEENQEKAEKFEHFMDADGSFSSTEVADKLSEHRQEAWSAQRLHKFLCELGVIKQSKSRSGKSLGWNIRSRYSGRGWHRLIVNEYGGITRSQLRWTPKGFDAIMEMVMECKIKHG